MAEGKFRYLVPLFVCVKVYANITCQKLRWSFLHLHAPNCTETINGSIIKLKRQKTPLFVALLNHFAKKPLRFLWMIRQYTIRKLVQNGRITKGCAMKTLS